MTTLLRVCNLTCTKDKDQNIFSDLNFAVNAGDIVVLQGKSGVGKTTLLKCIAHLNVYSGEVLYRDRNPTSFDIPVYRTKVQYIPQRSSLLSGTPRGFLATILSFGSRRPNSQLIDPTYPVEIAKGWGIDEELWDRNWTNLSGGEAQRIVLATALGLNTAEVLLLDEPTSALDPHSTKLVEDFIMDELKDSQRELKAMMWITHSEEQGSRIGTRCLRVTPTGCEEDLVLVEP